MFPPLCGQSRGPYFGLLPVLVAALSAAIVPQLPAVSKHSPLTLRAVVQLCAFKVAATHFKEDYIICFLI